MITAAKKEHQLFLAYPLEFREARKMDDYLMFLFV